MARKKKATTEVEVEMAEIAEMAEATTVVAEAEPGIKKAKSFRNAEGEVLMAMLKAKEDELRSRYGPGGEHEAANGWSHDLVEGSTRYDADHDKIFVQIVCPESKEQFRVFSSDLFQVRYAPKIRKQKRKEAAKARRRENAELLKLAKEGAE